MRAPTCTANKFSTLQITVQYHGIFVNSFGWFLLQLDNNTLLLYGKVNSSILIGSFLVGISPYEPFPWKQS